MRKLLAILVATKNRDEIVNFLISLNRLVYDPSSIAVVIYLNKNVTSIKKAILSVHIRFDVMILDKPVEIVEQLGYFGIHGAYNLLIQKAPDSYFYTIFSDEIKFKTRHFDKILKEYIGFFKDDIFLLRISMFKHLRPYTLREAIRSPENYPIITKKFLNYFYPLHTWGSDSEMGGITYMMKRYFKTDRDVICSSIVLEHYNFGGNVDLINMEIRGYMIEFYHQYLASPAFIIFFIKRAYFVIKEINPHSNVISTAISAFFLEYFIFFKRLFMRLINSIHVYPTKVLRFFLKFLKHALVKVLKFLLKALNSFIHNGHAKQGEILYQHGKPDLSSGRRIRTLAIKIIELPLMVLPFLTWNLMLPLRLYYKVITKWANLLE